MNKRRTWEQYAAEAERIVNLQGEDSAYGAAIQALKDVIDVAGDSYTEFGDTRGDVYLRMLWHAHRLIEAIVDDCNPDAAESDDTAMEAWIDRNQ